MSVSSQQIEVQGWNVHYLSAGSAGPAVVLLHGGGTDSASLSWRPTLEALAESHQIYAADWPGYGTSDRPEINYTQEFYVQFFGHLLEGLGIPRASLAGVSMGGGIALGFTLEHPERVEKLILVDSYGLQAAAPAHQLSYLFVKMPLVNELSWALISRSRWLARFSLQNIFHDPQALPEELVDEVYAEIRMPRAGKAFISFQKSEAQWGGLRTVYMPRLHEITAPTLIVHGGEDRLVPLACAREAHRRIPNATLEVMEGCGHWPQREQPEKFNRLVADFLAGDG